MGDFFDWVQILLMQPLCARPHPNGPPGSVEIEVLHETDLVVVKLVAWL